MNRPRYDENICSKMTFEDLRRYLNFVHSEREMCIDMGYYSNFLQNEETIQKRINEIKGREHYILQDKMEKIYECNEVEY